MADGLILDTTFLIDLERELVQSVEGPAQAFLAKHAETSLHLTFTVAGELAAGLLASATVRGASALGVPSGEIKQGLVADFCLIDLDSPSLSGATPANLLVYIVLGCDAEVVAGTCVGGSWHYRTP